MTANLESDSFFDFDGDIYSQDKTPTKLYQESKVRDLHRSSSSTSGHFSSQNTGDDCKMSTRENLIDSPGEKSAHSHTAYSRQSRSPPNSCQYSDSFDSEDSGQDTRQATPASRRRRKADRLAVNNRTPQKGSKSYSSASTNIGRPTPKKKAVARKSRGTKSVGNSSSRAMSLASVQHSPRTSNEITQKMLSAKGHIISRLRNELEEVKLKYEDTLSENRILKQVQRRQERALTKFQDEEAELPQLLEKHSAELDSMNRRIRKYQQKDKDREQRGKEQHGRLLKTKDELRKLQDLSTDKGLKERDQLRRRVDHVEEELEEKNSRLMDLEKYTENMKKNHRRAEHQWRIKELDIKNRLRDSDMERNNLRVRLREKEKELDVHNIYSHRFSKPPSSLRVMDYSNHMRLSVSKSLSMDDLQNSVSPRSDTEPFSPRHEVKTLRTNSYNERDVMRHDTNKGEVTIARDTSVQEENSEQSPTESEKFEIATTEEDTKSPGVSRENSKPVESLKKELTFEMKKEKKVEEEKEDEHLKILRMLDADVKVLETKKPHAKPTLDTEEQKGQVFGNTTSDNGAYKPTWLFGNKGDPVKQQNDEKKKIQLDEDHHSPKEHPKKQEEEEEFPFFGSVKTKQSPFKATKQPSGVVSNVRDIHKYSNSTQSDKNEKEDGIVFNSTWRDDIGESKTKASATQDNDYQKKKELLLQRMTDIDNSKSNERTGSGKSQKDYRFTQPVENLHHGRPSHPDVNLSPKSTHKNQFNVASANGRKASKGDIDVDELTFGSYAPSFSRTKETKQEKKPVTPFTSDLSSTDSKDRNARSSFGGENVFSTSTKAKPVADSVGLPWEMNARSSLNANSKQNTLFATNPYTQHDGPFAARPITTAASDDFDDDIEEYIM